MGQGGEPQTVQIVRQGEPTLYWFKFNPLYMERMPAGMGSLSAWNVLPMSFKAGWQAT